MKVVSRRRGVVNPGSIYVGRPTKWGNPFVVGVHGTQDECVRKYAEWLKTQPLLVAQAKAELKGYDLECWCAPLPCHADVLLSIANEREAK